MRFILKSGAVLILLCLLCYSHESSAQTSRGSGVPLESLPMELRNLSLKDYFLPSSEKKVGVVHALEGTVIVIHGTSKEGYFAAAGDAIYEKDSLVTLPESKCRIRFVDDDVVTMAPETEFSVEGFEDQRAEGRKSSFFRMLKGRAMFYAMRLFRYRDTRFTLATPTNTIGVRGTKFGAHVYYLEDSKTASRSILVADVGNEVAPYLAQATAGRSFTDCFSEDGVVDVDGRSVAPGQMYSSRTGQVIPTPPEVIRSFQQATEIRTEGATGQAPDQAGTKEEAPPPPPPTAVTGGVAPIVADIQENIITVVQLQTAKETETDKLVEPISIPPKDIGYFAAMLTNTDSTGSLQDVFIQFDDHVAYETDAARAMGLADSNRYIENKGVGIPDVPPYLTRIYLGGSADSGELGTTRHIEDTSIDHNNYMKWGYWTVTDTVTIGSIQYSINNRAYYVVGQATDNLDKVRNLGNVNYSGAAQGTYWSSSGGYNLTGGFTTSVNLNSGSISNFALSAADGNGRYVSIAGASGTIYGYANPGNNNCGHFDINPGSGTWLITNSAGADPQPPVYKAAQGALYGPNAEHIGGVWGMYRSSTEGAVGVFQGNRP